MDAVLALKNSITANRVGARPRAPPPHPGPPRPPPPAVLGRHLLRSSGLTQASGRAGGLRLRAAGLAPPPLLRTWVA